MTELVATRITPSRAVRRLRVGLLGLGTVGQGLCRLLQEKRDMLAQRQGVEFSIVQSLVRDRERIRHGMGRGMRVVDDVQDFLGGEYDLVVEALGGIDPASSIVASLLERGVPVVTANKALLAEKGPELAALARREGAALRFEASVAAGIPILGLIEGALQTFTVRTVHAVLNGTSNYIVTQMANEGLPFNVALNEAQHLGYAEADPSLDLNGLDAAQKITVLVRALGEELKVSDVTVEGIENVEPLDCSQAQAFGYALKPLAVAEINSQGTSAFVAPGLVRDDQPLAGVSGVTNGVVLHGDTLGQLFLSGPGAGALPTAASLLDDMVHLALKPPGAAPRRRLPSPERLCKPERWFLSLTPAAVRVEDLLDFVSASGVTFHELRETHEHEVTGITGRLERARIQRLEASLQRAGALKRFRAYRVLDPVEEGEAR